MIDPHSQEEPLVRSVFHPSDFTEASENAFAHALAIALFRNTQFTILHVEPSTPTDETWTRFPAVRSTLHRWGYLEEGSPKSALLEELAVRVSKVAIRSRQPLSAIVDYLDEHPTELIVLSTRGNEGLPRWIRRSVSEPLARRSRTSTLFVPAGASGFVDRDRGQTTLRRVLLPVDLDPNPGPVLRFVARFARFLGSGPVEVTILHVGDVSTMPALQLPAEPACAWTKTHTAGDVVKVILDTARRTGADLIAMATAGHEGILDALRGSTTEQVLRGAPCPVLAVPAYPASEDNDRPR